MGKGVYVDTVGRNKEAIKKYIQNQLKEDEMADQMTIKEYYDPFTGEEYQKRNSDKINPLSAVGKPFGPLQGLLVKCPSRA